MSYVKLTEYNGTTAVTMSSGDYTAIVAYELGSNVIRLRDDANGIEFFRYDDNTSPEEIRTAVWGLPSLYLPNRFEDGVLKTSDNVYNLPVNIPPPENTHLHGFLHQREHTLVSYSASTEEAVCKTKYVYDSTDEFYQFFPVDFIAEFTFTLSKKGLEQKIKFTNTSDKQMPMSFCTHTAIKAPFKDGGKEENIRIRANIGKRISLNDRNLPTEELVALTDNDKEYISGSKCPVLQNVDNEMFEIIEDSTGLYGLTAVDKETGAGIRIEVSKGFKYWIFWNCGGFEHYFCPEPMTALINAPNLSLSPEITGYKELAPGEEYEECQKFSTYFR
ncbi:MAG: aldose 1-epimerase [Ruminococcus sp.]|jgi:aldose 1-epimerase|nr:aldose 1-epimerase [Ruminococcus sp.]